MVHTQDAKSLNSRSHLFGQPPTSAHIALSPRSNPEPRNPNPPKEQDSQTLGGSWVVISGVISPLLWNITKYSYPTYSKYNPTYNYP